MATPSVSISEICTQISNRQKYNVPPVRFNIVSPYDASYSKYELDMRRKAEVLKYKSNVVSTQTNNLTKSQKWAMLANNNRNVTNQDLKPLVCPLDRMIPTPTSSCDVPGPIIYLYDDETVPLYNYSTKDRVYPFPPSKTEDKWYINTESDTTSYVGLDAYNYWLSLIITYNIDQSKYAFQCTSPVLLCIQGNTANSAVGIFPTEIMTLNITNVTLNIFYNSTIVYSDVMPNTLGPITFDVSNSNGSFSASQYIGNITFSNIGLYTESNYAYDFKISYDYQMTGGVNHDYNYYQQNYFNNTFVFYLYLNETKPIQSSMNCNLRSSSPSNQYNGFSFSGIPLVN